MTYDDGSVRGDAGSRPGEGARDDAGRALPGTPARQDGGQHAAAIARPDSLTAPGPASRRSGMRWLWLCGLIAIVGGGAGWYLYQRQGGGRPPAPVSAARPARIPVEVADAVRADVPIYYNGLGTVQAFNTVTVRSRVDGQIVTIAFREGQMVKVGDLLAEIDPRPYRAVLDQALAKKMQSEATLANTKLNVARTQQLAARDFATRQQVDQQNADVRSQTAQIAADQAAIDSARTQLDYATIRAPLAGRTGIRLADQGNIARAADTTGIVEITQIQPISVLFTAPEGQLGEIAAANASGPVKVTAAASDGKGVLAEGVLALVNNQVDAASGTVRLKATFANQQGKLWPGLSVNTRILVRTEKDVVTVPDAAVMRGQDELFCFVVGPDNKAMKRRLKVGPFSDGIAVIEDGLKSGEMVVVAGQSRLQSGSEVDAKRQAPSGRMAARPQDPTTPMVDR